MTPRLFIALATLVLAMLTPAAAQTPPSELDHAALEALSEQAASLADYNRMHYDEHVRPAQASSQRSSQSSRTAARSRATRVPYMIGDSPFSSPLSGLRFDGANIANIEHPIFGNRRYNVAENNTSLPQDRLIFAYRHFNNAYGTNVLGEINYLNADRFDIGFEKTLADGMLSAQLVAPLTRQIASDLDLFSDPGGNNLPVTDRSSDFGNLAATFKLLLTQRQRFAVAAGLAVNIPTADDARIEQNFDDPSLVLSSAPLVRSMAPTSISLYSRFENETVNLIPFLTWAARPTPRFFHQGFLQIDAPLNRSNAEIQVDGLITPDDDAVYDDATFNVASFGKIDQQTLLRLNLAFGYWLVQGSSSDLVKGVAGIFECHYTTALDNANPFVVPVTTLDSADPLVPDLPIDVVAGPTRDEFNQVNLTAGVTLDFGRLVVTNGIICPVTDRPNRSFDLEYSVYANVRF